MDKSKNRKIELISIVIAIISIFLPRTSVWLGGFEREFYSGSYFIIELFRIEGFMEWVSDFLSYFPFHFVMFWIQYITYTIATLLLIVNLITLLKSLNKSEIMCDLRIEEKQARSRYVFILFIISGIAFLINLIGSIVSIDDWFYLIINDRLSIGYFLSFGYFITLIATGVPVRHLKKNKVE